jgi:hypothetical protein
MVRHRASAGDDSCPVGYQAVQYLDREGRQMIDNKGRIRSIA